MMSNLYEQVQKHARHNGERVALWQWGREGAHHATSYAELAEEAERFAKAFAKHSHNARIIPMYLSRSATCVAAMVGAVGAGHAFSCLNQKLRVPQIISILEGSQAMMALIDGPGLMNLRTGIENGSPITRTRWWLLRGESFLPQHDKVRTSMQTSCRVDCWPEEIDTGSDGNLPKLTEDEKRVGCCLFTSGSTGLPKGVLISEHDLRARAEAEVMWFELGTDDVLLSVLPFSFDVGLNQLLTALMVGCPLVLLDSWLPADILRAAAQFQITGISGVPAIWVDMLNADMKFETSGRHAALRYLTVSGGDMSPEYLSQLEKLAPNVGIFKTYGQTEAFRTASLRPDEFGTKRHSVGRAFEGSRFYVVRRDGTICEPNEVGEILHTGLGIMLGYLDGHVSESKLIPNPFYGDIDDSTNVIITGDLGFMDQDGYLFLKGRRDRMLKVSGNRVYPEEITKMLLEIESVQAGEVIGVKAGSDTCLFAFVALTPAADMTSVSIRRELMARLPSYMVPKEVVVLKDIPQTGSGKTNQPLLREFAEQLLANGTS